MTEDTLVTLRATIKTLRALHKTLKEQRRQLVQVVGDGVEIEMISARVGFAIKQLQDACDLLSKLRGDSAANSIDTIGEPIELNTDFRGHDAHFLTEPKEKNDD
jgi:vacuolar-type H+-ATPase subunit D/Vma8